MSGAETELTSLTVSGERAAAAPDPSALSSSQSAAAPVTAETGPPERAVPILIVSIFVLSTCCIFYELLIGTVSSYLLGNSVTQFSLTIGLFMFFMGIGSFVSKFVIRDLFDYFIGVEIAIALVGGLSVAALHLSFALTKHYYLVAFGLIAAIGVLIGFEIPLVTRLAQRYQSVKDALAHMLAFDYLGALVASVLFPLVFLPYFGLMQTAFIVGLMNVTVAFVNIAEFRTELRSRPRLVVCALAVTGVLLLGLLNSFRIVSLFERLVFEDEVIHAEQSSYQKIVVTRHGDDVRLFINGDLQFCSIDEYRYHEPLVHVPLGWIANREQILLLGGGDGFAAREILKYPDVGRITVVDLDPRMTALAREHELISGLNGGSFRDPRVRIVNQDAYSFVEQDTGLYSAVIIDLPDPNDLALGKLYSKEFYTLLARRLARDGVIVTQSTSPYMARVPFWSINHTMREVFPHVVPYTVYVPSFGQWGFNAASQRALDPAAVKLTVPTRYLNSATLPPLFVFDSDMSDVPAEENRLDNQILVQYYEESGDRWN